MTFNELKKTNASMQTMTTENGATMYATTGTKLVDMNFKVASYRNMNESAIVNDFTDAYFENPIDAVRWLFFARDIRGNGLGERRLFRICIQWLATQNPKFVINMIRHMAEFGRYDDIFSILMCNPMVDREIFSFIKEQITKDVENMSNNKPISLMAKWLPSVNTSSLKTRKIAKYIVSGIGGTEKAYRKVLANLRKYLDIVEVKASDNRWGEIDYNTVPSQANVKYNNAFMKHDETRRMNYLDALQNGDNKAKINAGVLFPYEVVRGYSKKMNMWNFYIEREDTALEMMWKNLPDIGLNEDILVVADGSGSMRCQVSGSTTALDIANSLAIYTAEHNKGKFRNKYITFSSRPQLVDFSNAETLKDKLNIAFKHDEVANTNIEAVFKLILNTAKKYHYTQSDMPSRILIISDMEFDWGTDPIDDNLFNALITEYSNAGYKMPKLVFWNVNSRTCGIPVHENELGFALVSGFSTTILNMVMSDKLDPAEILHDAIYDERYHIVEAMYRLN